MNFNKIKNNQDLFKCLTHLAQEFQDIKQSALAHEVITAHKIRSTGLLSMENGQMTECQCNAITKISGRDGQDYTRLHLVQLKVDAARCMTLYQCPVTGNFWKKSMSYPEAHGGGVPEYDQISQEVAKKEFSL